MSGHHTAATGASRASRATATKAAASQDRIVTAIYISLALLCGVIVVSVLLHASSSKSPRIRELLRIAAQNAATSEQDGNPVLAVAHAADARAHLAVARTLATEAEIEACSGVRVDDFSRALMDRHAAAIRGLTAACPALAPAGLVATHSGWLAR